MRPRFFLLATMISGLLGAGACGREPLGPELHSINGHVKLTGYLVHDNGTFAGTKVVGDADGLRVDLVFGSQVVRTATTTDGIYRFTDVPQGGYYLRCVVAGTVGDSTLPVTVSRLDIAVSDTLSLFAKGDLRPVPNPRIESTTIWFELPDTQQVEVKILNTGGQTIRSLFSGEFEPGLRSVYWNGRGPSGLLEDDPIHWVTFRSGFDLRAHLLFR